MEKKKLTLILNTENSYENKLLYGTELIDDGKSGLRFSIDQPPSHKRTVYTIRTSSVNVILIGSHCPEAWRYDEVNGAFGDKEKIDALDPSCEMLKISAKACIGCPSHPFKNRSTENTKAVYVEKEV